MPTGQGAHSPAPVPTVLYLPGGHSTGTELKPAGHAPTALQFPEHDGPERPTADAADAPGHTRHMSALLYRPAPHSICTGDKRVVEVASCGTLCYCREKKPTWSDRVTITPTIVFPPELQECPLKLEQGTPT